MGFADMSWKVVPVTPRSRTMRGKASRPAMRLAMKKGSGATYPVLWLSKAIVERLRITDRVVLLVNHHAIAVRAAEPNDPHARRIGKSRAFTVREFEHLLRPTESWGMEAEIDEGHAVAYLPDELVRRMRGAA